MFSTRYCFYITPTSRAELHVIKLKESDERNNKFLQRNDNGACSEKVDLSSTAVQGSNIWPQVFLKKEICTALQVYKARLINDA